MNTVVRMTPRQPINAGVAMSVLFHAVVIGYLLYLVHPHVSFLEPKKAMTTVELAPPPPPPPPPPQAPPPPQQIVTNAPVTTPDVPTAPPVVETPPPPPPPAHLVGTTVPAAYYNSLEAIIQKTVQYPKRSLDEQEEGNCLVRVTFSRDGAIEEAQLVKKSGFSGLDGECREVFRRIGHFPVIPLNANPEATDFSIELPINFALQ